MNTLQTLVDDFMQEMGWDYWDQIKILNKLKEELKEIEAEIESGDTKKLEIETGDLLFAIACHCRRNNIDMDEALKKSIEKFKVRDKDRY